MDNFFLSDFWKSFYDKAIDWLIHELPSILVLIVLFIISFWLLRVIMRKIKKIIIRRAKHDESIDYGESEKRINTLMNIFRSLIKIIIWAIFLMILLSKFGINIGPILASAGILGLAIGFGAQELVRDFISGFFMLLENQIRAGDVAIINGTGGLVERIELRTITLRDFSGVVHVFQNGKINSLANMTKEWSAMVFDVGVAYKEDVDEVMNIMQQVGDEMLNDEQYKDLIIQPLEVFGLDKFADSALVIKARLKTKPIQQWTIGREYRRRLKKAFDQQGIEIPFPHTTVYWGEEINPLKVEAKAGEEQGAKG
jgi:moderate conductance mechanosensitive channel